MSANSGTRSSIGSMCRRSFRRRLWLSKTCGDVLVFYSVPWVADRMSRSSPRREAKRHIACRGEDLWRGAGSMPTSRASILRLCGCRLPFLPSPSSSSTSRFICGWRRSPSTGSRRQRTLIRCGPTSGGCRRLRSRRVRRLQHVRGSGSCIRLCKCAYANCAPPAPPSCSPPTTWTRPSGSAIGWRSSRAGAWLTEIHASGARLAPDLPRWRSPAPRQLPFGTPDLVF